MSSFIGCKISLISKAGIRYEGILYTIDPKESTVALSKVKSFGTEDRKVERNIPARDEIYEFIIFRGSDIHDLNVCERSKEATLLLEDSAIVRAETSMSGNIPHGVLMTGMHQEDDPSAAWKVDNHRSQPTDKFSNNAVKTKSSKDSNTKQGPIIQPIGSNKQNNSANDSKKPPIKKNEDYSNGHYDYKYERSKIKQDRPKKPLENYDFNYDYDYNYDIGYKYRGNGYYRGSSNYAAHHDYNNYDKPARRYRKTDYNQNQYYSSDTNKLRGFESSEYNRDYSYSQYHDYTSSRQRQERCYDENINKTKRRPNINEGSKQKDVSFKEDYDFETANAIIAKELANMNITVDKAEPTDVDDGVKDDGETYRELDANCYDKTKSFFDKIGSEMMDRANGKTVRPMNRKEERKMNVETFGVAESNNRNFDRNGSKWSRGGGGRNMGAKVSGRGYVDAVYSNGSHGNNMKKGDQQPVGSQGRSKNYSNNNGRRAVPAGAPAHGDLGY